MDSKENSLNNKDLVDISKNVVIFSAPALAVFFTQLQMGVSPKAAILVALLTLYGLMADLFRKYKAGN